MNNLKEYIVEKLKINKDTEFISDMTKRFFHFLGIDNPGEIEKIKEFDKLINKWFKEKGNENFNAYAKGDGKITFKHFNIPSDIQKEYKSKASGYYNTLFYKAITDISAEAVSNKEYVMFPANNYKYFLVSKPDDSINGKAIMAPNNTILFM